MTKKEKLEKVTEEFSLLPEEKQDYILGVLQALVFAHNIAKGQTVFSESEQNNELNINNPL